MTLEGVLLRVGAGSLRSNALRYVAADDWLEHPGLPQADPDEALSWLAGEYLRAFGPARPEDFRWWTGVSKERATAALGSVETVEVGGGYLLPSAAREDFEAVEAPERGSVDLLPKWDCYTMGYAPDGRRRFVRPEARARVYNEAAGAWEARFAGGGGGMQVDLELFERPGALLEKAVEYRFEVAASLLGARSVSLD
jgi:hypothetical protein